MSAITYDVFGSGAFGHTGKYDSAKTASTHRPKGIDKLADWVVSGFFKPVKIAGYEIDAYCEQVISSAVAFESDTIASVKDMVKHIQNTFGLNLSQIAKIIGVSRATVYNHINDDKAVAEHYIDFCRLSLEVESQFGSVSHVLKNILFNNRTLLRHLECSYKNAELIMSIIAQIKDYKPQKSANYGTISDQKRSNMIYVGSK
jgi:plasmid maintenance system antidote protein VapI